MNELIYTIIFSLFYVADSTAATAKQQTSEKVIEQDCEVSDQHEKFLSGILKESPQIWALKYYGDVISQPIPATSETFLSSLLQERDKTHPDVVVFRNGKTQVFPYRRIACDSY